MTQSYVNGSNDVVSMTYRADGLRVTKANAVPGSNANKFTHYRYDGQMGIEDVEVTSGGTHNSVIRYAIGGRGLDAISRTASGGTSVSYPIYDTHGNNIGLISKSGSSWTISDERTYDTWGQVRTGGTTGDQKGRYCANIGHGQDDESGLVYMRARFYESTSGRFLNEDIAKSGENWFVYCKSCPTLFSDSSGLNETIPSVSVGMTGASNFAGTINNIFLMGYVRAQGLWMYINVSFAAGAGTGRLGIAATLQMLKSKAQDGGFQGIMMEFQLVEGGRFGPMAQRFVQEIQRMGDQGRLEKNGDITQLYWLWGAMGSID